MTELTIYKYQAPTPLIPEKTIELPEGAEIVEVGVDPAGDICLWALVDPNTEVKNSRKFQLVGTGHPITRPVTHLGSIGDGRFVWHILEVTE
mgnify:FL=1